MKSVTIYTGPLCNFCDAAKRLLTRNNVEYKEINISTVEISISLYSTLFLVNNLFAASQKLQSGPV